MTKGEGGQKSQKIDDVFYERPLTQILQSLYYFISTLDWLLESVPGTPGEDYPILAEVPETGFTCDGQVEGGKIYFMLS